jgi:hypothetical protein
MRANQEEEEGFKKENKRINSVTIKLFAEKENGQY